MYCVMRQGQYYTVEKLSMWEENKAHQLMVKRSKHELGTWQMKTTAVVNVAVYQT